MAATKPRLFISYKRATEPDEPVALQIFEAFRDDYDVFIDQKVIRVGTDWAQTIENEISRADFLISLLSQRAVESEMVVGEIEKAHGLVKGGAKKPQILPVRLAYSEPFRYPLSAFLNRIHWAYWQGPHDTPRLIEELRTAMRGGDLRSDALPAPRAEPPTLPPPTPVAQPLEISDGPVGLESKFYVVRPQDEIARRQLGSEGGATLSIKGPRQMGKSSLLVRLLTELSRETRVRRRVVNLDLRLFERATLDAPEPFFRAFCDWVCDELECPTLVDTYWSPKRGLGRRTTLLMEEILKRRADADERLVLAIDEADRILDSSFAPDFFGMLRSWHDARANRPLYRTLDMILVTSTEPYQLNRNLNTSPFSVGEVVELNDFDLEQVKDLAGRHGKRWQADDLRKLFELLRGHPYLTRRALFDVAAGHIGLADLFERAATDGPPFGDHLRFHVFGLHRRADLVEAFVKVLDGGECDDLPFYELRSAGLVRRDRDQVLPRCALYQKYFREHLK
jgi:hypothetical protein